MLYLTILILAIAGSFKPTMSPSARPGDSIGGCDSVEAGDVTVAAQRLQPFTLLRNLTLTRGDTVKPFGRQTETLTSGEHRGQGVMLDVLVFDTPNGKTVDSSWVDARTLRPLRFQSNNASRAVGLEFDARQVKGRTVPSKGAPTEINQELAAQAFEWNVFGLAIAAMPLRVGYCAAVPVYSDRSGRAVWYKVTVEKETTIQRKSGRMEPVWDVRATADTTVPAARYWISRRHRVISRVLVSEPGISIMYARD
jgi:hypothetical protein